MKEKCKVCVNYTCRLIAKLEFNFKALMVFFYKI